MFLFHSAMIQKLRRSFRTFLICCVLFIISNLLDDIVVHPPSAFFLMNRFQRRFQPPKDTPAANQFIRFELTNPILPNNSHTFPRDFRPLIVHLFSAFHDNREIDNRTRITALVVVENCAIRGVGSKNRDELGSLWCRVGSSTVKAEWAHLGNMYKFMHGGRVFGEFMIRCEVAAADRNVKKFTICLESQQCSPELPVEEIKRPMVKKELGFCGSNWYHIQGQESSSVSNLIEWFEYHHYMGVEGFHVRVSTDIEAGTSISIQAQALIEYYKNMGIAHVRPAIAIPKPSPGGRFRRQHRMDVTALIQSEMWIKSQSLQLVAINDCFYRNMFTYEHIAIIDTDELLVPEHIYPKGLADLVRNVTLKKGKTANMRFKERRFYKNCHQYLNQTKPFKYNGTFVKQSNLLKYKSYAKAYMESADSFQWRTPNAKSVISPEHCCMITAHRCIRFFEEQALESEKKKGLDQGKFNKKLRHIRIHHNFALDQRRYGVHHYRQVDGLRDKGVAPRRKIAQYCEKIAKKSINWDLSSSNLDSVVEIGKQIQYMERMLGVRPRNGG
ncbi:uncharacterized protein LOC142341471 [Convolutriloba macropyga]|uniref:uncharacterized protein LOC142341471 n=1 Tax=Convolutriloba macropyga TaxID=536237 RepID=UPI003F521396